MFIFKLAVYFNLLITFKQIAKLFIKRLFKIKLVLPIS
jgi:hypothetical protein